MQRDERSIALFVAQLQKEHPAEGGQRDRRPIAVDSYGLDCSDRDPVVGLAMIQLSQPEKQRQLVRFLLQAFLHLFLEMPPAGDGASVSLV